MSGVTPQRGKHPSMLLELGECTDQDEGSQTKGQWGKKHTVMNNGSLHVTLHDCSEDSITLLPVHGASYGVVLTGAGAQAIASKGDEQIIPLTLQLDPVYVPMVELINNFLGANNAQNRVNAKLYFLSNSSMEGDDTLHHQRTLTLTNGYIKNISYAFGDGGDFISVTVTGTNWRSQYYGVDGKPLDDGDWNKWNPRGDKTAAHAK